MAGISPQSINYVYTDESKCPVKPPVHSVPINYQIRLDYRGGDVFGTNGELLWVPSIKTQYVGVGGDGVIGDIEAHPNDPYIINEAIVNYNNYNPDITLYCGGPKASNDVIYNNSWSVNIPSSGAYWDIFYPEYSEGALTGIGLGVVSKKPNEKMLEFNFYTQENYMMWMNNTYGSNSGFFTAIYFHLNNGTTIDMGSLMGHYIPDIYQDTPQMFTKYFYTYTYPYYIEWTDIKNIEWVDTLVVEHW